MHLPELAQNRKEPGRHPRNLGRAKPETAGLPMLSSVPRTLSSLDPPRSINAKTRARLSSTTVQVAHPTLIPFSATAAYVTPSPWVYQQRAALTMCRRSLTRHRSARHRSELPWLWPVRCALKPSNDVGPVLPCGSTGTHGRGAAEERFRCCPSGMFHRRDCLSLAAPA